jgi:hypothetical protein
MTATGPGPIHRMFMPSLAMELPDEWTVSESAIVRSPSGTEIRVWLDNQPDTTDVRTIADRVEASARDEVGPIDDVSAADLELGRRAAHARQFTFERAGDTMVGRIVCSVEGQRALIASGAWPRQAATMSAAEMDTTVAGLRLLDSPVAVAVPAGLSSPALSAANKSGLDIAMWSPLLDAWASDASTAPEPDQPSRWSPAELAVVAAWLGAAAFPTVGVEWLAGLPTTTVDAITNTVTGSLIARALVVPAGDGTVTLADGLRSIVEAALLAELVVDVAHMTEERVQHTWFGVTLDRATRIAVTEDETRRIDQFPAQGVPAAVLAAIGDIGQPAAADLAPPDGSLTTSMVRDPTCNVTSLTRITTTWRLDGRLHGGVFFWARRANGAGWLAVPAGDEWTLHRAEGLRATLLQHLPRGAD